ncbi:hypothetical protein BH23THE1_BH23THE1_31740 [soil metagenome]
MLIIGKYPTKITKLSLVLILSSMLMISQITYQPVDKAITNNELIQSVLAQKSNVNTKCECEVDIWVDAFIQEKKFKL